MLTKYFFCGILTEHMVLRRHVILKLFIYK
nr:MAG TPA: hypothetical protein [Caudoviricetes sp.]